MRYYVIINGVNSLTIEGLAIRTLPPISKPAMRNIREEIDGRDGDITTELGYGAYDKTLEIGLYGDYDINKIIAFFNSKGKIIFSDEPDKYYNFEIVDKIDYTKLVKFRTATINIHCQPFKYPVSEEPQVEEYEYVEATGTNVTLDNTSEAIFNKIDLLGNTSQDGTPTPSSPIPVNVVSGDNTINIEGKNVLKPIRNIGYTITTHGITYLYNADGSISVSGTATQNTSLVIADQNSVGLREKLLSGNFYLSGSPQGSSSSTYRLQIWGTGGSIISTFEDGAKITTFTNTTSNFNIAIYINSGITINAKFYPMLEYGNSKTTYEPYIGSSYPIQLGDIELCKIGTYQDYIYKDNGSWYLHKEIGKVVLDGTEGGGTIYDNGQRFGYTSNNVAEIANVLINTASSVSNLTPSYSNRFTSSTQNGVTPTSNTIGFSQWGTTKYIYLSAIESTVAGYKTWLSNNNVEVYFPLATPTNTLIEDTTLIEQLEALKLANSYATQTNISQENNDLPFILDLSALKEGSDHLVINNAGNIYAKPTMDIEGTGVVDIYLNDVQILEADLTETNNIVIDTEAMEAYNPDTNALANRQITGDYSKIKLEPGENDLRFSGDLSMATITDYTRWL